jgi:hypothetical protein
VRPEEGPVLTWVHPDEGEVKAGSERSRAHIQFITSSSMVLDVGPRCADQINRSNEAIKTTPQKTIAPNVSTLTRVPGVLEKVFAMVAIYDLHSRPQGLRLIWH